MERDSLAKLQALLTLSLDKITELLNPHPQLYLYIRKLNDKFSVILLSTADFEQAYLERSDE